MIKIKNSDVISISALVAISTTGFLVLISYAELKWQIFYIASLFIFFLVLPLRRKEYILLMLFALSVGINLDVNFMVLPKYTKYYTTGSGFNLSLANMAIALLYFFWLVKLRKEPLVADERFLKPMFVYLIFLGLSALSLLNSKYIMLGLFELKKQTFIFFMIFYLALNMKSANTIKSMICMIFAGVIISSAVGFLEYFTGKSLGLKIFGEAEQFFKQPVVGSRDLIYRVSGLMGHANMFGMYLISLLPVSLSISFADVDEKLKYFSCLTSVIGILALIITFSRGAIISFVLAMLILLFFAHRSIFKPYNKTMLIIFSVLFISAGAVFGIRILQRFSSSPPMQLSIRFLLNASALKMIAAHPFLGVGLNNFSVQLNAFDTRGIVNFARFPVHNLYLLIASETGLFSLFFFLLFILLVLKDGFHLYFTCRDPFMKNLSLGICGGILAVLAHSMIDYPLRALPLYLVFFVLCSMIFAMRFNFSGMEN